MLHLQFDNDGWDNIHKCWFWTLGLELTKFSLPTSCWKFLRNVCCGSLVTRVAATQHYGCFSGQDHVLAAYNKEIGVLRQWKLYRLQFPNGSHDGPNHPGYKPFFSFYSWNLRSRLTLILHRPFVLQNLLLRRFCTKLFTNCISDLHLAEFEVQTTVLLICFLLRLLWQTIDSRYRRDFIMSDLFKVRYVDDRWLGRDEHWGVETGKTQWCGHILVLYVSRIACVLHFRDQQTARRLLSLL
jgi:hypothetical protein